jgi:tetratricopeptide (TPR) repeat protein
MSISSTIATVSAAHPFPGLRPFDYPDHEFFFGRQNQIYALYRLIDRFHFITVVGSSGSGKSSLVRAGLLPLLDTESKERGGRNWVWRQMRPGDAPLLRLTNLIASLSEDDDPIIASGRRDGIAAHLDRSSFGISEAVAEVSCIAGKSVVLVIDQFEELFRYATGSSGNADPTADEILARDEATQFVQLLLEASRNPSNKIHVALTMRSDFIGDCAQFHGLPEAVCEAQFLVPALTRDQLDEVIRQPIQKAGAEIEPQLVERILNDCSTEMDQLPVLQHCLSRLWEERGKAATENISVDQTRNVEKRRLFPRISLDHYRNIGEFANALSQHADEVLKDLPGPTLQLAVEQVFRALSELDKEGRATRRWLKLSQLVAETGVDEQTTRQVLDRFRANDCSFLRPTFAEAKEINGNTRIDVGHESLLRRWDKVSGHGGDLGWLRKEQRAGERYRGLLAIAESGGAVLPGRVGDDRWMWWKARPRTPAWADRYGGKFALVEGLLLKSRQRQRLKKLAVAAVFLVVAGAAVVMTALWQTAVRAQKEADHLRSDALKTIQHSTERLAGFLNDGTIRAVGAEKFLEDARVALDNLAAARASSEELSEIRISLMLAISDVKDALGEGEDARKLAEDTEKLAIEAVEKYPKSAAFKHALHASQFRIGDQLAKKWRDSEKAKNAEQKYLEAVKLANQLVAAKPDNPEYKQELTVVLNKVGDMQQFRSDWQAALDRYSEGLRIAQSIAGTHPIAVATQRNRIAQVLSARRQPGDRQAALAEYREALRIMTDLWVPGSLAPVSSDDSLVSNIALTHRRIGDLLRENPEEAEREYQAAVDLRRELYQNDPRNVERRIHLATDCMRLGDVLMRKDRRGAFRSYSEAAQMAEAIVAKDPKSTTWQRNLATLNTKRADLSLIRGIEIADTTPEEESARRVKLALERYRAAARNYEDLFKLGGRPHRELFDVQVKIGDVLVRQGKYDEALEVYQLGSGLAVQAATTQRVVDWLVMLATTLEQTGDVLASGGGSMRLASEMASATSYFEKALEVIDIAVNMEPGNQNLQMRRSTVKKKTEAQQ